MITANARLRSAAFGAAAYRTTTMMRAGVGRLVVVSALLATALIPIGPVQAQIAIEPVVDAFVRIAERGEYGDKAVGVTRWARPIRVAIAGLPTGDQAAALAQHLAELSKRTRLPIGEVLPIAAPKKSDHSPVAVDLRDPAAVFQIMYHLPAHGWTVYLVHGQADTVWVQHGDILVIFTDHASATQIARILRIDNSLARSVASGGSPCFTMFFTEPATQELKYGIVVLRTDVVDWMRRRCLHEEMTQVMGLRNDVKGSEITLFDDMPMRRRTDLTAYDWMFLEILYDPRLKPGLAGAELRRVARELLAERMARKE